MEGESVILRALARRISWEKRYFGFHPQDDNLLYSGISPTRHCETRSVEAIHKNEFNCVKAGTPKSKRSVFSWIASLPLAMTPFGSFNGCNILKQKAAFTLAEVLITLGIIGIVAAMTLPMLIAKYQEKVLVTAAKKGYSVAVNTVTRWNAANEIAGDSYNFFASGGASNAWSRNTVVLKELAKYLNIVQVCDKSSNLKNCGGKYTVKQYKKLNNGQGGTKEQNYMNNFRIVLADGSFIAPQSEVTDDGTCKHTYWSNATDSNGFFIPDTSGNSPTGFQGQYNSSNNCGFIHIDTNGLKGPNQVGKDYFLIGFTKEGKPWSTSDNYGNLDYVLKYDKLIKTEDYTPQESGAFE